MVKQRGREAEMRQGGDRVEMKEDKGKIVTPGVEAMGGPIGHEFLSRFMGSKGFLLGRV